VTTDQITPAPPDVDWHDVEGSTQGAPTQPRRANGQTGGVPPPPHDNAAERAVLGAALLQPALIPELAGILRDDDLYHPAHVAIWATITDLHATGAPVDVLTVAQTAGTDRTLTSLGGPLYINDLTNAVPQVNAATWYARVVADRAAERRTVQLGTWLAQAGHNGDNTDLIRARLEAHLSDRNPAERAAANSWAPVDLEHAITGDDTAERPCLMPRSDGEFLLYPGAVHVLSGEPASGKTWVALHAAATELDQNHDVTIVDFEDRASRIVPRLILIGATPAQIRAHLRYIRPDHALDTAGRAALDLAVTTTRLVILDGVTEAMTLHGLDLSSNPDIARFYELLPRRIADHGPAVLLIDHVVKDHERQGRWSIGGQHKLAGIDGVSYNVRAVEPLGRGRRGTARLTIAKDRYGYVEEIALGRSAAEFHLDSTDPHMAVARLDPPEAMPTTETGEQRPTVLMEKVSRYLEVHPGSTGAAIDAAKLGKAKYVRQALATLVAEGRVEAVPGPRNAQFHHVSEPFRRDPEALDWRADG